MASITLPSKFIPRNVTLKLSITQRITASPFGGSEQAIDLLNDRWVLNCELPPRSTEDGAWVEAFIGAMRGQVNTTTVHHFKRPAPIGTIRGVLTLSASVTQGAAAISVSGCTPMDGTFKAGDLMGVGGLLLMAASDCTASGGVVIVPLANRVRKALSAGASVTWDKPSFVARLLSTSDVSYAPGYSNASSFDFGEKI